jgi:hypothetical protein
MTSFDVLSRRTSTQAHNSQPIGTRLQRGYDRTVNRVLAWWLGIGLGVVAARIVSHFGYLSHGWATLAWWVAMTVTFAFVAVSVVAVVDRLFPPRRRQRRAPATQHR